MPVDVNQVLADVAAAEAAVATVKNHFKHDENYYYCVLESIERASKELRSVRHQTVSGVNAK